MSVVPSEKKSKAFCSSLGIILLCTTKSSHWHHFSFRLQTNQVTLFVLLRGSWWLHSLPSDWKITAFIVQPVICESGFPIVSAVDPKSFRSNNNLSLFVCYYDISQYPFIHLAQENCASNLLSGLHFKIADQLVIISKFSLFFPSIYLLVIDKLGTVKTRRPLESHLLVHLMTLIQIRPE